jgi:hypothetical protein
MKEREPGSALAAVPSRLSRTPESAVYRRISANGLHLPFEFLQIPARQGIVRIDGKRSLKVRRCLGDASSLSQRTAEVARAAVAWWPPALLSRISRTSHRIHAG